MRVVIYLLLLANLVVFLWHYRSLEPLAPAAEREPDGVPRLVLARERAAAPVAPDTHRCLSLGPFTTVAGAEAARKSLERLGIAARRRAERDTSRRGFWVYIPPASDRKAARRTLARLKAAGVKDHLLVAAGPHRNAISLGVFSRPELARRRLAAMREKGFPARIEPVPLPRRVYWLDWPAAEGDPGPEHLARLKEKHPGIGQLEQACPAGL